MLEKGKFFHQPCGGKPEKTQIIDLKKLFQHIVYWLLLLMSDFQTRSPIWPAIWNKRLLCCAVVGLLTKKALNYDCLFATTYGKKYFAVQWQIKSFMQWLRVKVMKVGSVTYCNPFIQKTLHDFQHFFTKLHSQENQGGEYQKRFRQSVCAQVAACLAVVTLIKACQQNLDITQ